MDRPVVLVERALFVDPRLAPLLLQALGYTRQAARQAGLPVPAEVVDLEAALRRVIGTVVDVVEPAPSTRVWISAVEAAARLGLSRERVGQMIRAGLLAGRKAGRGWIVDEQAVADEVAAREAEAPRFRQIGESA